MLTHKIRTNLNGLLLGVDVKQVAETESTNSEGWKLIDGNFENGTVVVTDNQTKGKGRASRQWFSVPGKSLTFSILLNPCIESHLSGWFPLLTGIAICNALKEHGVEAGLKWPNDIVVGKNKLGGILCESRILKHTLTYLVIGIGLNVNEQKIDLPEDVPATSCYIESKHPILREILLAEILNNLDSMYRHFVENKELTHLKKRWMEYCVHVNQTVKFQSDNETLMGQFTGINHEGAAMILLKNKTMNFSSGDIHITGIEL